MIGHRGGNFGPENSMKNFRGAVENKLEGIEFDVSRLQSLGNSSLSVFSDLDQQRQGTDDYAWRRRRSTCAIRKTGLICLRLDHERTLNARHWRWRKDANSRSTAQVSSAIPKHAAEY